ncbi:MAG: DUF58 domain-containing protein [Planctomycetales bacterium]|nr:DUF58 domain-containing protein [Planctomycetales bacterium]
MPVHQDTDAAMPALLLELLEIGLSPWFVLGLILLPLVLLAWIGRIYPANRLVLLACLNFAVWLPTPFVATWWWVVPTSLVAMVLTICLLDWWRIPSLANVQVSRQMARVASLGNTHEVQLWLDNRGRRSIYVTIKDDCGSGMRTEPESMSMELRPRTRQLVNFRLFVARRGAFDFEFLYFHVFSPWKLWCKQVQIHCPGVLHVYPNIKQVAEYALLARTNRLSQIGVRRTRHLGQDNDFERLRDYQQDDNYKHIDWRSTARRQKLIVRQYQADQSQRVIFMVDSGRMMTNQYEGMSLLDYALNSVLMLSYVALQQGDSVGMICFSDQVHTYVPPTSGKRQMNRILHAGFNQFPRLVQSRFDEAFLYLSNHCRRRSLVVLVTNVIDEVNADQIHRYLGHLNGAHLPLLVLLRDHRVFEMADAFADDREVLYRSAAASQLLVWRQDVIHRMRAQGSLTLDLFPEEMTSSMVNKYLEIKAKHLL